MVQNTPTEPKKYAIVVQAVLPVAASEVWQLFEQPHFLEKIHPFAAKHTMVHWPGSTAYDIVEYYSGMTLHRHFFEWSANCLKLDAHINGQNQAQVRWDILPKTDTETDLTISLNPVSFREYPKAIRYLIYRLYINHMLRTYTEHVIKGAIYYFETGQPVKPNQFGKLRYFSY